RCAREHRSRAIALHLAKRRRGGLAFGSLTMSTKAPKILFVDRDGTLIEEPADEQIDRYEKFRMLPGAISALKRLVEAGYELVMVSNQDGLGTPSFPEDDFAGPQQLLLDLLAGEGVQF